MDTKEADAKTDWRFWFGVAATGAWIAYGFYVYFHAPVSASGATSPTISDLGSFYSGFAAPIAFIWLVIGYRQQGDELRQNNIALNLQADELRNSVKQQANMFKLQQEQLEHERLMFATEQERAKGEDQLRRHAAKANFELRGGGYSNSGGVITYEVHLFNLGNTAIDVSLSCIPVIETLVGQAIAKIGNGAQHTMSLNFRGMTGPVRLSVMYLDVLGERDLQEFDLQQDGSTLKIKKLQEAHE